MIKRETRLLGIDDTHFERRGHKKECLVVAAMYRGAICLDAVLSTTITIDGDDVTANLAAMINSFRAKSHVQAVFLDGIAMGGLNVVDIYTLHELIAIPLIVIVRKQPDLKQIATILQKLGKNDALLVLQKAGSPIKIGDVYVQYVGITKERVAELLALTCTRSYIPEPLRAAHLIGQGIVLGQSKGNA